MSDKQPSKIGAGHFPAFVRQGAAELRNALYADSNVAQRYAEPGLYGTAIPSEIDRQRQAEPMSADIGKEPHAESGHAPPRQEPPLERD